MAREWRTSRMNVNWQSIRPLNGAQDKAFEELCSQLARCEAPERSRFERKGAPDAGVECYATLEDGTEWAWQAKYFHTLGASQWSQIDSSVRSALKKHPRIAHYIVCCPLDLPDGRSGNGLSAHDRWNRYVAKWRNLATDAGTAVEFTYWGSHELLNRLARPEHSGRVRFWFGVPTMDAAWFQRRVDEAVATAGPRYSPELHIDLPIAEEFEAFGRTEWFFDNVICTARELWSEWQQTCSIRSLDYREEGGRELAAEIRRLHSDCEITRAKKAAGRVVKQDCGRQQLYRCTAGWGAPFPCGRRDDRGSGRRHGRTLHGSFRQAPTVPRRSRGRHIASGDSVKRLERLGGR